MPLLLSHVKLPLMLMRKSEAVILEIQDVVICAEALHYVFLQGRQPGVSGILFLNDGKLSCRLLDSLITYPRRFWKYNFNVITLCILAQSDLTKATFPEPPWVG